MLLLLWEEVLKLVEAPFQEAFIFCFDIIDQHLTCSTPVSAFKCLKPRLVLVIPFADVLYVTGPSM